MGLVFLGEICNGSGVLQSLPSLPFSLAPAVGDVWGGSFLFDISIKRFIDGFDMETWKEFDASEVTHSVAHHLLAIHELGRDYGGWARVSDIARQLDITRGSVSINLRSIKKRGLVLEDDHRQVKLSPDGLRIVEGLLAKKTAIHAFLRQVLGVEPSQADVDSCKIEHLLSDATAEHLVQFLRFVLSDEPAAVEAMKRFRQLKEVPKSKSKSNPGGSGRNRIEELTATSTRTP